MRHNSRMHLFLRRLGFHPRCCREYHKRLEVKLGRLMTQLEVESFEEALRNQWQADGRKYGILIEGGSAAAGPPVPPDQIWDALPGHKLVQLEEVQPKIFNYGTRDLTTGSLDQKIQMRLSAMGDREFTRLSKINDEFRRKKS